jgi:hypothetical protein
MANLAGDRRRGRQATHLRKWELKLEMMVTATARSSTKWTVGSRMTRRVKTSAAAVFLTREFRDLSDGGQVNRALRNLAGEQIIAPLRYGVYARLRITP